MDEAAAALRRVAGLQGCTSAGLRGCGAAGLRGCRAAAGVAAGARAADSSARSKTTRRPALQALLSAVVGARAARTWMRARGGGGLVDAQGIRAAAGGAGLGLGLRPSADRAAPSFSYGPLHPR